MSDQLNIFHFSKLNLFYQITPVKYIGGKVNFEWFFLFSYIQFVLQKS